MTGEALDLPSLHRTPSIRRKVRELIVRLAQENPRRGYQRIVGELKRLGIAVSATTFRKVLRDTGLEPASKRVVLTWREFLHAHARTMLAVDFFRVTHLAPARRYQTGKDTR